MKYPLGHYGATGHRGDDEEADCVDPSHWEHLPFEEMPEPTRRLMLSALGWSPDEVALAVPEEVGS